MEIEQAIQSKIWRGVVIPLILFNIAVFCLAFVFAPRLTSCGWITGDRFNYFYNSHDFSYVPGIMIASLFFSVGIYCSVRAWVLPAPPSDVYFQNSTPDDLQP